MKTRFARFAVVFIASTLAAFAGGCAADAGGSEEEQESESAATAALPIRGEWAVVHYKGSFVEGTGSVLKDVPFERSFDAKDPATRATFDLDGSGDGWIRGNESCKLEVVQLDYRAPNKPTTSALQRVFGIAGAVVGIVGALDRLAHPFQCPIGSFETKTVWVMQKRGVFGRPDPRLWANVGVLGETKSTTSADAECRSLRGVRYVLVEGNAGCIGYADGAGRTVRMITQRPGEIYVQRATLKRPGG